MEAMMLDRIVEVFCEVDDFCQAFVPQWEASLLGPGGPAPRGPHVDQRDHHAAACAPQFRFQASQELLSRLRRAAAARLLSRHAVLRALRRLAEKCLRAAGGLPCQSPRDQDRALLHRLHRPCDNHRLSRHKVFADLAQRGKMGWFFGFKLHLVFNNDNEIVALKLTPGNVHDTTPVPALTRDLIGKLFGDKGYLGQKLAEDLLRRGLTLFTRVRKNMKSLPLSLQDKALLNARNMAETIIGHIKEFSSLNLSKHRSAINAFVHIIAAITAYQINPFKPKLNLQPRYQLQTTA